MAKKANTANITNTPGQQPEIGTADKHVTTYSAMPSWLFDFKIQALFIAILAFAFYWNTFKNEYALDDTIVIVRNEFVHEGFAGIPDILGKDAYYSYYNQLGSSNQLRGGRYRPLSIATFAIEQQFFGSVPKEKLDSIIAYGLSYGMQASYEKKFLHEMHIRHIINVVWYALAVIVLLYFLRQVVFKHYPLMAFIAAIIFTIHPLHTEVVANVKSRDEIMSILFICLTFIFAFKYKAPPRASLLPYGNPQGEEMLSHVKEKKRKWWLALALLSYFLAFLSKEYAITLVVLLPLSFYLFAKDSIGKSILSSLPYYGVVLIYVLIRWQVIGERNALSDDDIQINPYAWASATEKLATEIATSLNYLKLLIFPHPLSSDYSYNQIPYKDFSHPLVWLSIVVHLGLLSGLVYFFKKRSVLCFAIAFYLFNLLMVNNLLFDIGATMGERLIFHASVGFVIAIAWLLVKGMEKIRSPKLGASVLGVCMLLVILLCGFKTVERNKDWKNDETLFFHDVHLSPNSFLVSENVGAMLVNKSDFEKDDKKRIEELQTAVKLFTKVIGMQENYVLGYMNRSAAYFKLGMADSMVADLNRVNVLYPRYPSLPSMYYHAGILYLSNKQYERAAAALTASLKLFPGAKDAQDALSEAMNRMKTMSP